MKTRKTQPGNPKLAVAYIRVSTEEQNLGPEAQRAAIQSWALREGVTVASFHEDRISGTKGLDARDGLLGALAAIREAGAGVLIIAKRDRLARSVAVAAAVEDAVRDAGARVFTADGVAAEDTPEGRLMRTLLDAFSEYERARIALRTKGALAVKKARGLRNTRHAPVGFRWESGALVADPAEAGMVARMKAMRERGLSVARIAQILNGEGMRLRGGVLHVTTVARTLRRVA